MGEKLKQSQCCIRNVKNVHSVAWSVAFEEFETFWEQDLGSYSLRLRLHLQHVCVFVLRDAI